MMVARACLELKLLSYAESTPACCHTWLPMDRPFGVQARALAFCLKCPGSYDCLVRKISPEVLDLIIYQQKCNIIKQIR